MLPIQYLVAIEDSGGNLSEDPPGRTLFQAFPQQTTIYFAYLVAVEDGGGNLSEDPPGLALLQALPLAEVVIELAARRYLHHQHHLLLVLKHCKTNVSMKKKVISLF